MRTPPTSVYFAPQPDRSSSALPPFGHDGEEMAVRVESGGGRSGKRRKDEEDCKESGDEGVPEEPTA